MSASPGKQGGARGLVHLRNVIEDVGGEVISLQVKIPQAHTAFDAEGHLIGSKQELKQEIEQIFRR